MKKKEINNNPYNSELFKEKWGFHFDKDNKRISFNSIQGLEFIQGKRFSLYINTLSNLTFQNYYNFIPLLESELYHKIIMVKDVPSYFLTTLDNPSETKRIKLKKIKEYVGYYIDFTNTKSVDEYLKKRFNSKNRLQLKAYLRKLEQSFSVTYQMYYGTITRGEYNIIIEAFYSLSVKSFENRKIANRKLEAANFEFFKDVTYEMILQKRACMFVISEENRAIGISINFIGDNIMFGDSTVYDLNYGKFNIGSIMLIKQINWCIAQNISIYDFSKGHFPYKEKWCNAHYYFEHHIFYDSQKISNQIKAFALKVFLDFKQYLREHKIRKYYQSRNSKSNNLKSKSYKIEHPLNVASSELLPVQLSDYPEIWKAVNDFLYSSPDCKRDLKIFKMKLKSKMFYIQGRTDARVISTL